MGARARIGLMFYNTNAGGKVITNVAGGSLPSVINQINLSIPNTNTPLGEALWSAAGYFAQQTSISGYTSPSGSGPYYNNADYGTNNNSDPMNFGTGGSPRWPVCQKNFVLLLTDGEPCSDGKIPDNIRNYPVGRSPFQCVVGTDYQSCPSVSGIPAASLENDQCGGTGREKHTRGRIGCRGCGAFMHTKDLQELHDARYRQHRRVPEPDAVHGVRLRSRLHAVEGAPRSTADSTIGPLGNAHDDLAIELGRERGRGADTYSRQRRGRH